MKKIVPADLKEIIRTHLNYDQIQKNGNYAKAAAWITDVKYKIADERVLEDPTSPTGKVYIGLSKKPLTKVKDGFGWYGVIAQTDNRELVQCHICGKWFRQINQFHLESHDITYENYKEKFGILRDNGLIADAVSYTREENGRQQMEAYLSDPEVREKFLARMIKANEKSRQHTKGNQYGNEAMGRAEHDNKFGLCERQIGFGLVEYIRKYHALPTGRSKKGGDWKLVTALQRRYGSRNLGFQHYGLPTFHRWGTTIEMTAANGKMITYSFVSKEYDREAIYNWIVTNTPNLNPIDVNKFAD